MVVVVSSSFLAPLLDRLKALAIGSGLHFVDFKVTPRPLILSRCFFFRAGNMVFEIFFSQGESTDGPHRREEALKMSASHIGEGE